METMNAANQSSTSQYIIDLDNTRKALEEEAQLITDELTQPTIDNEGKRTKPMGVDTPLVDEEGYPRSDIDIYRARDLRRRLNEIRYDHKIIMRKIEENLTLSNGNNKNAAPALAISDKIADDELKARLAPKPKPKFDKKTGKWVVCNWDGTVAGVENGHLRKFDKLDEPSADNTTTAMEKMSVDATQLQTSTSAQNNSATIMDSLASPCLISDNIDGDKKPFAKINEMFDRSPAALGGLMLNDSVIRIGPIDESNHKDLQAVANVVHQAFQNNKSITFVVLRQSIDGLKKLSLQVKPGVWEGNGILGCRIVKA